MRRSRFAGQMARRTPTTMRAGRPPRQGGKQAQEETIPSDPPPMLPQASRTAHDCVTHPHVKVGVKVFAQAKTKRDRRQGFSVVPDAGNLRTPSPLSIFAREKTSRLTSGRGALRAAGYPVGRRPAQMDPAVLEAPDPASPKFGCTIKYGGPAGNRDVRRFTKELKVHPSSTMRSWARQ